MKSVTVRGTIPAPAERVFDFLLDSRNDERWCPLASGTELIEGDGPGEGALYRFEQSQGPGMPPLEQRIRTTVANRPSRIEWVGEGRGPGYHATMLLRADGQQTHVQHTNAVRLPNHLLQLVWFAGAQVVLRRQLRNLSKELAR